MPRILVRGASLFHPSDTGTAVLAYGHVCSVCLRHGRLSLQLTGGEGVKDFIRTELHLPERS